MDSYQHYITVDNMRIADVFTTAFRQPKDGDICINDNGGRLPEFAPTDGDGLHLYRYDGGQIRKATEAELAAELAEIEANRPPVVPTPIEELQAENRLQKAQLMAQGDRQDFIEDCIAEMAMQLYA